MTKKRQKTAVTHTFTRSIIYHSDIVLLLYIAMHDPTVYLIWPRLTYIDINMDIVYF